MRPSESSSSHSKQHHNAVPHYGGLCHVEDGHETRYTLAVANTSPSSSSSYENNNVEEEGSHHYHHHEDELNQHYSHHHHHHHRRSGSSSNSHKLVFTRNDLDFAQRLFSILDTESKSLVKRSKVREFTTQRCPVFWRRDDDLRKLNMGHSAAAAAAAAASAANNNNPLAEQEEESSPTFDEIWDSVVSCSAYPVTCGDARHCELGLEGWMVFCRFIALAQYLEAKRRFSARHLQQTMRHRNSPRGSELVMVNVPPPEPPAPLTLAQLASYEERNQAPLPLPELDLDHSLLAVHDSMRRPTTEHDNGRVKIDLFGYHTHHHHHHHHSHYPPYQSSPHHQLLSSSSTSSSSSMSNLEFAVTFTKPQKPGSGLDQTVVRRSMTDMKWLDDTVTSHKTLGGTLCGRILPPFPSSSSSGRMSLKFTKSESGDSLLLNSSTTALMNSGSGAIKAAAKGVGKIKSVAKSLLGSYLDFSSGSSSAAPTGAASSSSSTTNSTTTTATSPHLQQPPQQQSPHNHHHPPAAAPKKISRQAAALAKSLPESYYNPNSPDGKARQVERYLNYLLDHPALSTSFPLNAILTASESGLEAAKKSLEECNKAAKELREQTPQLVDGGKLSGQAPNFAWVRTAAQAAMALRVHGMLETTGMPSAISASARLQHASLPNFGKTKQGIAWEDDSPEEQQHQQQQPSENASTTTEGHSFEEGVIRVESELQSEDNFERNGDDDGYDLLPLPVPAPERRILTVGNSNASASANLDSRFHYGSVADLDFLSFEPNDDESKTVILGNLLVDDNIDKLREVIGSVDNTLSRCLGSSGGIGTARCERLKVQLDVIRGLDSWEGMRGQFVSQRSLLRGVGGMTQSRELYEESDLILVDDLSWQASLAHSAVGAAEDVRSAIRASRTAANAKAAANSAAMSAQSACDGNFATMEEARAAQTRSSIAQSHAIHAAVVDHEAKAVKRRATLALAHDVKCWNVHRKGELLKSCLSYAKSQHEATRRAVDAWSTLRDGFLDAPLVPTSHDRRMVPPPPNPQPPAPEPPVTEPDEVIAKIFESPGDGGQPTIVASEHLLFGVPATVPASVPAADPLPEPASRTSTNEREGTMPDQTDPDTPADDKSAEFCNPNGILPFATASPIPQEEAEQAEESLQQSQVKAEPNTSMDDKMSDSMQSLVDGLMSWGGVSVEVEEEHMALPAGMAASIALEESGVMNTGKIA